MSDGTLAAALQENKRRFLQEEVSRLRETNATLRVVIRTLRRTNESLREQVSNASENDDTFKRFCAGEFDADFVVLFIIPQAEDGLSDATQGSVEPLAIELRESVGVDYDLLS